MRTRHIVLWDFSDRLCPITARGGPNDSPFPQLVHHSSLYAYLVCKLPWHSWIDLPCASSMWSDTFNFGSWILSEVKDIKLLFFNASGISFKPTSHYLRAGLHYGEGQVTQCLMFLSLAAWWIPACGMSNWGKARLSSRHPQDQIILSLWWTLLINSLWYRPWAWRPLYKSCSN